MISRNGRSQSQLRHRRARKENKFRKRAKSCDYFFKTARYSRRHAARNLQRGAMRRTHCSNSNSAPAILVKYFMRRLCARHIMAPKTAHARSVGNAHAVDEAQRAA
jgi:hypothetical protein